MEAISKKIKIILEYLNRYKFLIAIGLLFIMGFYSLWLSVRNSRARSDLNAGELIEEQRRVEQEIIPMLDERTPSDLERMGNVMWE